MTPEQRAELVADIISAIRVAMYGTIQMLIAKVEALEAA